MSTTRWIRCGSPATREPARASCGAHRQRSWKLALADQGVDDDDLAEELGERFGTERRSRHDVFADVAGALTAARRSHRLGLLTNGASCLQREKLQASGLAERFDAVVVSGDVGVGKPDPRVFAHTLALLDSDPREATMIGDSIARDIDGAIGAGLRAIWLNRAGRPRPGERRDLTEIVTLAELEIVLGEAS